MPVFIRPARVEITDGGSGLAGAVVLTAAGVAVLSAALAVLVHLLLLILVAATVLATGCRRARPKGAAPLATVGGAAPHVGLGTRAPLAFAAPVRPFGRGTL